MPRVSCKVCQSENAIETDHGPLCVRHHNEAIGRDTHQIIQERRESGDLIPPKHHHQVPRKHENQAAYELALEKACPKRREMGREHWCIFGDFEGEVKLNPLTFRFDIFPFTDEYRQWLDTPRELRSPSFHGPLPPRLQTPICKAYPTKREFHIQLDQLCPKRVLLSDDLGLSPLRNQGATPLRYTYYTDESKPDTLGEVEVWWDDFAFIMYPYHPE